jgi:predicted nucleic acid-binding protein
MPVLDTNFLIALQERDEAAMALLASMQREPLLVPSIVAVEFLAPYGANARDAKDAYEALERSFTIAHTDAAWIEAATKLRARLRKAKKSIRLADFWIATWAVAHGTSVVTKNVKDFEAIGVKTSTWRTAAG